MDKPKMPFENAKDFLRASRRRSLVDRSFGDSEVTWLREGREVASGYFSSRTSSVGINETKQYAATEFRYELARELEYLGTSGRCAYNDITGDPRIG